MKCVIKAFSKIINSLAVLSLESKSFEQVSVVKYLKIRKKMWIMFDLQVLGSRLGERLNTHVGERFGARRRMTGPTIIASNEVRLDHTFECHTFEALNKTPAVKSQPESPRVFDRTESDISILQNVITKNSKTKATDRQTRLLIFALCLLKKKKKFIFKLIKSY